MPEIANDCGRRLTLNGSCSTVIPSSTEIKPSDCRVLVFTSTRHQHINMLLTRAERYYLSRDISYLFVIYRIAAAKNIAIFLYEPAGTITRFHTNVQWWKARASYFPALVPLAKKYLSIPATSVASERLFSPAGDVVSAAMSTLLPEHVDQVLVVKKNVDLF